MNGIQPPFLPEYGPAPVGVCSRWGGKAPCGAAGSHHVIWDSDLRNGCVCAAHLGEIRKNWVYLGLHPYTADCAAFTTGHADWDPGRDCCGSPSADQVPEQVLVHLSR